MKRLLGGFFFVAVAISLTASVCLADISGPRWPPITATGFAK